MSRERHIISFPQYIMSSERLIKDIEIKSFVRDDVEPSTLSGSIPELKPGVMMPHRKSGNGQMVGSVQVDDALCK